MAYDYIDTLIIGASAAGLMCAIEAGKRARQVLVLDHANKVGKKILMSGGGRCNFTNYNVSAANYLSHNPHFCKSALSRYTPVDFIRLVEKHGISYHEKTLGQLFCDNKSTDIIKLLLNECREANARVKLNTSINTIQKHQEGYQVETSSGKYQCQSLVIATGGLSIPTLGATSFGYVLAKQFGHKVWPTRAGLVPFILQPDDKEKLAPLSGVSANALVTTCKGVAFHENILITHRGLSGPAILQSSSYWQPGETVQINLLPGIDFFDHLEAFKATQVGARLKTFLTQFLPKRLLPLLIEHQWLEMPIKNLSQNQIATVNESLKNWQVKPAGTEGYRTAEVTLGGVDCHEISSKTMESSRACGLYFIGEVLDVTGWLGGYNFQWAWASGWCAGQVV